MIIDDSFNVFLDLFCDNFIEYLVLIFTREIVLKFSFYFGSLCSLGISIIVASKNELSCVPSVSILWNSLKSTGKKTGR